MLKGKIEQLYYVVTKDAIKEEVRWQYSLQLIEETMGGVDNLANEKKKRVKPKNKVTTSQSKSNIHKPTKLERKLQFKEYMRQLKEKWSFLSGEETNKEWGEQFPMV